MWIIEWTRTHTAIKWESSRDINYPLPCDTTCIRKWQRYWALANSKKRTDVLLTCRNPRDTEIDMGLGECQLTMVNATSKAGHIVQVAELDVEEPGTSTILCCKANYPVMGYLWKQNVCYNPWWKSNHGLAQMQKMETILPLKAIIQVAHEFVIIACLIGAWYVR